MKTFHLTGSIWIASDIHLGPNIPQTCQAFFEFLEKAYQQADHIILLGDIFDYWVGDDCPSYDLEKFHQARQASGHPAKLYLCRGNRDFLIGQRLANELDATLLDDTCFIENEGHTYLILHGDQLCTHDQAFMRFRAFTHRPWIQQIFLALPKSLRKWIGEFARKKSRQKPYIPQTADVHEETVKDLFNTYPHVTAMIHGHTHHPKQVLYLLNDRPYQRWVLHDWEKDKGFNRAGFIKIEKGKVQALTY
ncbi:UDP-2,3-diacylglucosamine diphosphatase [Basilea psittacipulmonis]|uniref:UDP-2,3-diacylglucosamine hydrolase n=1 Tax=Basilea psittacipulmonis DSM 24701 TaxID=1072685 RepID=A0A077DFE0_9BURK|nr:UDP-2,3-diacylglucosamine diphosphatase [Basilea psittacipulmonis]AIL32861.1 hypothetical protein IX83_05600 [Basilea psittacipulmonis DSM 24701]